MKILTEPLLSRRWSYQVLTCLCKILWSNAERACELEVLSYSLIYICQGSCKCGYNGCSCTHAFLERLLCTHRYLLKPVKIQEFHYKLMKFDFLHPQLSISYATPVCEYVILCVHTHMIQIYSNDELDAIFDIIRKTIFNLIPHTNL